MTKTIYIIASRYAHDEWYVIHSTCKTLKEAQVNWKHELKGFFEYGPDDCTSLILAKCKFTDNEFTELQDHIKKCEKDDMHTYNEDFTSFMRKHFYDNDNHIYYENCEGAFEIWENAESDGKNPENKKVFNKYFNQYFKATYYY